MSTQGLNGDTALKTGDVLVGWVPGEEYGYKRDLKVTVEISMEWLTRQDSYETTSHAHVTRPLDFAITSAVWNLSKANPDHVSGGAKVAPLRELTRLAPGFTQDDINELIRIARYHLNGMTARCDHQVTPPMPADIDWKDRSNWALDHTPACPVTGYKYGHAWLVKPLPEDITPDRVRALLHITES